MNNIKKFRIIKFKSKPILAAKSIAKSFGKRVILRKIDVNLNKGEMLGLLGSNGAGKSTFMNIVLGLLKCDYGDIFLGNTKLTNLAIHERSKLGMAYLPQQTAIFRGLTVEQNILAVLEISLSNKQERRRKLDLLLGEFSITHLRQAPALTLSGGERRRVEIARCLASQPKYILLDEPFAGVDPIAVGEIRKLVSQLKERGVGVLITDHNVRETLKIVDKVYIVNEGAIFFEGKPEEAVRNEKIKKFYLGSQFNY